jgi:agmatine deiminase
MSKLNDVRMPAEWEPHRGCFMAWPRNGEAWDRPVETVRRDYAAVAHAIRRFEPLFMIVDPDQAAEARRLLSAEIELLPLPFDEPWMRDMGPSFVKRADGAVAAVSWRFNGWGCFAPTFDQDARLGQRLAAKIEAPLIRSALAVEGGALHVDGAGTLLTTDTVILNKNRNPGITREAAEAEFARALGVSKTIWLPGNPYEKGTDGHIDGIACFVRPGVLLFETSASSRAEMRETTARNRAALEGQTDAAARPLEILTIREAPDGRHGAQGWGYSTSYVNFYIANGGVVMPSFGLPKEDAVARETVAAVLPDHEVVQVDISTLAAGGGGIHCITQQWPA